MAKGFLTGAEVEIEIDRLKQSDEVKLAQVEQRFKYRRRQYMYLPRYCLRLFPLPRPALKERFPQRVVLGDFVRMLTNVVHKHPEQRVAGVLPDVRRYRVEIDPDATFILCIFHSITSSVSSIFEKLSLVMPCAISALPRFS